jgi:hypothetical protein
MDENIYLKLIVDQIKSLQVSAAAGLPAGHPAFRILDACVKNLESPTASAFLDDTAEYGDFDAAPVPVIPKGFTEETLAAFLTAQAAAGIMDNEEDEEQEIVTALYGQQDIVGIIVDENGTLTEVGDIDQSAANAQAAVDLFEEEEEETIEVENHFTINYSRVDGQELTKEDVQTIINSTVSDGLKHFGTIQLISINTLDDSSKKSAVFEVLEEGKLSLKTIALGVTAYRGVSVFPGLGRIKAVGSVNFL